MIVTLCLHDTIYTTSHSVVDAPVEVAVKIERLYDEFLAGASREEGHKEVVSAQLMEDFADWLCDHHGCRIPIFPEHQFVFLKPAWLLDEERVKALIRRTREHKEPIVAKKKTRKLNQATQAFDEWLKNDLETVHAICRWTDATFSKDRLDHYNDEYDAETDLVADESFQLMQVFQRKLDAFAQEVDLPNLIMTYLEAPRKKETREVRSYAKGT